ncbi:MAG TPA: cytochrome c oxidase assembly protein [Terrimesophilobacter sp.]|nr:cytochrome c oxidase assembly protein [Terrimesophilobacter sp.]
MPRSLRILGPALLLAFAFAALIASLAYGGGATAPERLDPGPVVLIGLPAARIVFYAGAATTIGGLLFAVLLLAKPKPEFNVALDVAAGGAAVWTVAAAVTTYLTFLSVSLLPPSLGPEFGQVFGNYLLNLELGQAWTYATLVPAIVTILVFGVRNHTALVFVLLLAGTGLVPLALQGHAAGTAGHGQAVSSLGLHLVFASVWVGGLIVLVFLQRTLSSDRLVVILRRYSTLALVSFVVVGASGAINGSVRVGSIEALLTTPYGVLVVTKVVALVGLGAFGAVNRRWVIDRLERRGATAPHLFWWLAVAELAVMGIATGVGAGLARTQTPIPQVLPPEATPAMRLTGEPMPPELEFSRYFTEWKFDILWILIPAFLAFFYLAGVWRLKHRGDKWPVYRTILWLTGLAVLFYVTNGAPNVYERYLFSAHMIAHMTLAMAVPIMLAPAAPITLALRTIHKREDGSRGMREWILLFVHSRVAGIYANPVVAAAIFAGSLWAFYFTPVFRWAAEDHIGHTLMIVHFLGSGYLFAQALIGVDPAPYRAPYPLRLLVLLATMAFHAFFGLALVTGEGLLLADWFGAMGRDWGPSALADQQLGGAITWSVGEVPTLFLAIALALAWSSSDDKEAKRLDRKADRDGDADLKAYNEMLQRMQNGP